MRQTNDSHAAFTPHRHVDPCPGQLPVRFTAIGDDGEQNSVQLNGEHAVLSRRDGVVNVVPLTDYVGLVVAVRKHGDCEEARVLLRHRDPALDVVLNATTEDHEISGLLRAWSIWSDTLGVERMVDMGNGVLEPIPGYQDLPPASRRAAPRRTNRHFRRRRPCLGSLNPMDRVRGAEIIARH